ncbi:MAG: PASTA domain-containing protein [Cellulomonadaceae bacterium]|nr:PASTA domain-containing protein [Cellulomonadaceae bacterium]
MSRTVALRIGSGLDEDAETTAAAPPHRRRWRLIALIAVLVAALVGGGWWFMTSGPGAFTTVPTGLVGAEAAAVEAALTAAGLDFTETDPVFDPTIPDGSVVTTEPAPGERVRKDGSVAVSVSKGPDLRVVPSDLPGKPVDDATALLTQAGFVVPDPTHVYDDVVAAGIVIGISVEQGASLPVGTEVVLTVSDGPEPLTIISVTGATAEVAKTQLEAQGLRVAEAQDYSETVPAGSVISQDPAAGTPGHRTDTVTIVVSQGPPLVPVPNVVTMGVSAAKDALEAAGFVVDVNRTWPWDNVIVEQKPAANEPLQKGSTVTIYAG